MPTNKKIIKNDTLFFRRDNQRGGILFNKILHPLQELFSEESLKKIKNKNIARKNNMIKATESEKYDKLRKKKKGRIYGKFIFPYRLFNCRIHIRFIYT